MGLEWRSYKRGVVYYLLPSAMEISSFKKGKRSERNGTREKRNAEKLSKEEFRELHLE